MTYDPEKLRQAILGSDSDEEKTPEPEKMHPHEEESPQTAEKHAETPEKEHESPADDSEPTEPRKPVEDKKKSDLAEAEFISFTESDSLGDSAEQETSAPEPAPVEQIPESSAIRELSEEIESQADREPAQSQEPTWPADIPEWQRTPVAAEIKSDQPLEKSDDSGRNTADDHPEQKAHRAEPVRSEQPSKEPEPDPDPEPPSDGIEPPKELENAPTGDYAPLRQAVMSNATQTPDETAAEENAGAAENIADKSEEESESDRMKKRRRRKSGKPKAPKKINPPSPLAFLILIASAISLLGASIALSIGYTGTAITALGGIGLALAGTFVIACRDWLKVALSGRSMRYSANVSIIIFSLLGILIFVNIIAYRYPYRLDLSSEGLHSLSPQTLSVLDDINRAGEPIAVTAFASPTSGYRDVIDKLMDLYLYHSHNLEFNYIDPDIQRELAESKGITRNPSVLFELGENRAVAVDIDEPHFTSALLAVRQTHLRLVSFLGGHGEPDPFSDDRFQAGLSKFRSQLELEGYDVNILRVPEANGIPPETSLLIIASPNRDLESQELDAIGDYLDDGGSIMCFLEPGEDAGLSALLRTYGIRFNDGFVLDDKNNFYDDPLSPIVTGNPEHSITAPFFEDGMVFFNAGSLSFTNRGRLPDVETDTLVRSSASSWNEISDDLVFNEDSDTREALELAVIAKRILDAAKEEPVSPETPENSGDETGEAPEPVKIDEASAPTRIAQVLVVGDGSFIQNSNYDSYYNKDFALNAVNYLTVQHDLISIRPAQREHRTLDLTNTQQNIIFAISVILTPLLIAGLGGLVWWRRRC